MRLLVLVLILALLVPGAASAGTLGNTRVGFSADRVLVVNGRRYGGRVWAMPGEERHEQAIAAFHPIFLLHSGSPLAEIVVPQLKTIVEVVMPRALRLFDGPGLTKHPLGHDTIDGIATTRYAIDETEPDGRAEGTLWLSRDGIPIKLAGTWTDRKDKIVRVRWQLSHVKIGPQPPELFALPRGYSKLPAEAIVPLLGLRLKSPR